MQTLPHSFLSLDKVFVCNPGCPGTHYVDHLKLIGLSASAGITSMHPHSQPRAVFILECFLSPFTDSFHLAFHFAVEPIYWRLRFLSWLLYKSVGKFLFASKNVFIVFLWLLTERYHKDSDSSDRRYWCLAPHYEVPFYSPWPFVSWFSTTVNRSTRTWTFWLL